MKRRGAKRKASQKAEGELGVAVAEENHKEEAKANPRAKRAKPAKPEPEFVEEKRSLEDLWIETFPVGTEWDNLDKVYQFKWNFTNLEEAFEEGGKLYGQKVYLFGGTEPQYLPVNGENQIVFIPHVVVVVSPFPPSDKIGINSVQRETEDIVPMKQMKMDWVPYIPLEKREGQVERMKHQIYILKCTQRRSALKHLKIDRFNQYTYCMPYFYNPFQEDEVEPSTEVHIMYPIEPQPIVRIFDWEFDDVEEFTDKVVEEEELPLDQKEAFKDFVKEQVRGAKRAIREAREAKQKALAEISDETKTAIENMKIYKFYPRPAPGTPDISPYKALFINRYYGKAHEIL
uniref:Protein HEAT INTOLERANT 4-like n=1 Tax=Kalanchoe fedtschenkoi TaxID=63787 RepID=A0A7N0TRL6_KALFE